MYPLSIENFEKKINYFFKDKALLLTALTHSSFSNENRMSGKPCICNERLEFLGDSVLSLVVSEYLYDKFEKRPEGELTKIRSQVVCTRSLSKLAKKISLGDYLLLGKGESAYGRSKDTILENAFEALIAAIYLDSNNNKAVVAEFLLPLITDEIDEASFDHMAYDYKTSLQQFVQASGKDKIQYILTNEYGPDHQKTFEIEVRLNSNIVGKGIGKTKREAEQLAAKEALGLFGVK